jgi:ATP-dependent Clp protease ATP-binding subunit ClpA
MKLDMGTTINLTPAALSVLALAENIAEEKECQTIGTEHLALAITAEGSCLGSTVLKELGVTHDALRTKLEELVTKN